MRYRYSVFFCSVVISAMETSEACFSHAVPFTSSGEAISAIRDASNVHKGKKHTLRREL